MGPELDLFGWASFLFSFILVIFLLFVTLYVLKRVSLSNFSSSPSNGLKVVQSLSLGGRQRLIWVQKGPKNLILGVSLQQISLLSEWTSDTIEDTEEEALNRSSESANMSQASYSFVSFLRQLLRKKNDY